MVKKRHKSEPCMAASELAEKDGTSQGYLSEPGSEPEWKTGGELPHAPEPTEKAPVQETKPIPPPPQQLHPKTPIKTPLRSSAVPETKPIPPPPQPVDPKTPTKTPLRSSAVPETKPIPPPPQPVDPKTPTKTPLRSSAVPETKPIPPPPQPVDPKTPTKTPLRSSAVPETKPIPRPLQSVDPKTPTKTPLRSSAVPETKPIPPPLQSVDPKTPIKTPRRSSRQRTPTATSTAVSKKTPCKQTSLVMGDKETEPQTLSDIAAVQQDRALTRRRTPSRSPVAASKRITFLKPDIKTDAQTLIENVALQDKVPCRKRNPSASLVKASKKIALSKSDTNTDEPHSLTENAVRQDKSQGRKRTLASPVSATKKKASLKPDIKTKPLALTENAVRQDTSPGRKRTPASPVAATKTRASSKPDIKTESQALIENVVQQDKAPCKKKTPSASTTPPTKKVKAAPAKSKIKTSAKLTENKIVPDKKPRKRTQSATSKTKSAKLDSKIKTFKSKKQDLNSKTVNPDTEKAQPKKRRMQGKGDAKVRKPTAQRGRTKRGAGKKTKRSALRSPLPSFDDDDDDDVFKLEAPKTEQIADDIARTTSEERNHFEYSRIDPALTSLSSTADSNGITDADMNDFELESNQSSDDELPDVLSQDSKKILEGDIVWVKTRKYPYWPAVVKRLYKTRATILFSGELNKSTQKGKGAPLKALKLYSCPEKEQLIEAGLKHPRVPKEEFQESVDLAEDYITKRGLGKAQGASFFTMKDYSITNGDSDLTSPSRFLAYTPSMRAGSPLRDTPLSPLTPPCEFPDKGIMDSPNWRTGRPLSENQDQSFEMEEGGSDVDEELLEKREKLTKLQDRLMRYITRRPIVKDHLMRIFHGKEKSTRHELFFTAGSEPHNRLKYMRGFGPLTDDDKQDELMMFLRKVYEEHCLKEANDVVYTSYIADVWFPEVIIFALQRTQRICHKTAERMFKTEEKNAMEITGALDDIKFPSYLTEEEKNNLLENVPKRAARQLGFSPREFGLS